MNFFMRMKRTVSPFLNGAKVRFIIRYFRRGSATETGKMIRRAAWIGGAHRIGIIIWEGICGESVPGWITWRSWVCSVCTLHRSFGEILIINMPLRIILRWILPSVPKRNWRSWWMPVIKKESVSYLTEFSTTAESISRPFRICWRSRRLPRIRTGL